MRLKALIFVLGLVLGLALENQFSPKYSSVFYPGKAPVQSVRTELDVYAPKHYSRANEEIIIRHFFKDRREGFFLDVGCYDYLISSNTYYLEKQLGWRGIGVDANPKFREEYIQYRPKTQFFSFFVSDRSDTDAAFYVITEPGKLAESSGLKTVMEDRKTKEIHVKTITLNDLLSRMGVKKIDFLSMDIEYWEPKALAGFEIKRFQPELVCIEANKAPVRDQIIRYFLKNDYERLDQYLLFDDVNWYFAPLDRNQRSLGNK